MLSVAVLAQSPNAFNYQGVARDNDGNVLENQSISLRLSIVSNSPTGTVEFVETHTVGTNDFGLFNVSIGTGSLVSGSFSGIGWGSDSHFIKVELDPAGGTAYQNMGVSQLLSVPYAMYANSGTAGPTGPTGATGSAGAVGPTGPAGVSPQVGFRATSSSTTAVGAATTYYVFGTEVFDDGSNYDNTTGIFTAPTDGLYYFEALLDFDPITASNYISIGFEISPGGYRNITNAIPSASEVWMASTSTVTKLNAGDAVKVRLFNASGNGDLSPNGIPNFNGFSGYQIY